MARPATVIRLNAEEEETLRLWVRGHKSERRMVERARIVLLAAAATSTAEIARQLTLLHGSSRRVSYHWFFQRWG